jgi:hypothetical protein
MLLQLGDAPRVPRGRQKSIKTTCALKHSRHVGDTLTGHVNDVSRMFVGATRFDLVLPTWAVRVTDMAYMWYARNIRPKK